ncbi:putative membrane protein [Citreicella sp. SE45]|nr:putative membrane protein [Citreicella sp. SE45]
MNKLWAALVFVAAVIFAAGPVLFPGFAGFAPDAFPMPQDNPPVQPAGYTFAIWGLIYLWLVAGTGFGLFRRAEDPDWQPHRKPLLLSLAVGVVWLPVAQLSPIAATVLIWVMLISALIALFLAGDMDRWLQTSPLAVYAGWLTAAASVSIGLLLAGYGLLPATPAALVGLAIALAIALVIQYRLHRAPLYGITVIWALVGVIVANSSPFNIAVAGLAVLGIFAILALRGTDTE